jgi:hypothetical protein
MNLPQQYQDQILAELEKPKAQQKYTEDLFIELERALTTVSRAMPDVIPDRDKVRRILLKKFKTGIINNRVLFRDLARIARANKVGADEKTAAKALTKLFQDNDYTIEKAFSESVGDYYAERDIGTRINSLLGLLEGIDPDEIEGQVRDQLTELVERVEGLLRGDE